MKLTKLFYSAITLLVAVQLTSVNTLASDRIERAALNVLYDQAVDGNVRTEGLSWLRRACRNGLFGEHKESDAFKNNKVIDAFGAAVRVDFGSAESTRSGNLNGDIFGATVAVDTHFRISLDVSFFYTHESNDFTAYNGALTGDAKSNLFGFSASKKMTDNCYLGASFFFGSTEINTYDSGFAVSGNMDACRYGMMFGGGYTRQWGKAGFGENLFVDTNVNFGYQVFDVDQRNGGFVNSFDVSRFNFMWGNTVGTQFTEKLTGYARLMTVLEMDDCRTTTPLNFPDTLPTSDSAYFIGGFGFNYNIGGWEVGAEVNAKMGHRNSDEFTGGIRLRFDF